MMKQYDILDKNGNITGKTTDIRTLHDRNFYHRAVQIWIYNDGYLILQKRSPKVRSYPNKYEASASGHVESNEESITTAIRETREELGIKLEIDDLKLLFHFFADEEHNREFRDVYLVTKKVILDQNKYLNKEVSGILKISLKDYKNLIKNNYQNDIDNEFIHQPGNYNDQLILKIKEIVI